MEKARRARATKKAIGYGYDSTFPTRLRELLQASDVTQESLASALDISRQSVAQWKDGKTMPDIRYLEGIAKYFDVSADWLIGLSKYKKNECESISATEIGLSETAIYTLQCFSEFFSGDYILPTVNLLIEQECPSPFDIEPSYFIDPDDYMSVFPPDADREWLGSIQKQYAKKQAEWERKQYVPVIGKIERLIKVRVDSDIEYDITEGGTLEKSRQGEWPRNVRLDSMRKIKSAEIIEKALLSDIEQSLKELKRRIEDDEDA